MTEEYVGCQVSVEVRGGLGFYQGRVVAINTQRQTLTLTQVIHNGRPAPLSEVTINAGDVVDLKILSRPRINPADPTQRTTRPPQPEAPSAPSKTAASGPQPHTPQPHTPQPQTPQTLPPDHHHQKQPQPQQHQSQPPPPPPSQQQQQQQYGTQRTPKVPLVGQGGVAGGAAGGVRAEPGQVRRKPRTSVGETLAHGSHHYTPRDGNGEWQQVTQGQPTTADYSSPRRGDPAKTQAKKERQRRARNEATFSTPIDDMLSTEFDFESNLALFNKQAVYEEIQSHKPDVVRQTVRENYRYDENVLPSKPLPERKIIVPTSGAAEVIYANDNGLLVPSVTSDLRAALLSTANQHGLTNSRQLEMIGRAATEVIMSISGCSHRLDPRSSQQPPVVVMLCGSHLQGAAGVNTARQLECHGVQTLVVTPPASSSTPTPLLLTHELQLYGLTGGRTVADPCALPSTLDLIVDARLDHAGRAGEGRSGLAWLASTATWASASRAPVLALDPPSDLAALPSSSPPLPARVLLCVALPLAYTPARGKVYLLSLPLPLHTFAAVGIKYVSPFGAKLVIPLHPCE